MNTLIRISICCINVVHNHKAVAGLNILNMATHMMNHIFIIKFTHEFAIFIGINLSTVAGCEKNFFNRRIIYRKNQLVDIFHVRKFLPFCYIFLPCNSDGFFFAFCRNSNISLKNLLNFNGIFFIIAFHIKTLL